MSKKKTIRKYDLQQTINRLQSRLTSIEGREYHAACSILEELRSIADVGKNNTERREVFRSLTLDVSFELYMWLKSNFRPSYFKYNSLYTVYFGTDDEFDEMCSKNPFSQKP